MAVNVRGTDLGSFVAAARPQSSKQIQLPRGWWLEWGGQYENLQRASHRLMVLVPASLLLILVLLYNTFTSMRMGLMIFSNVLLGACGWNSRLVAAQTNLLDHGRRRLHHTVWRFGAEWRCAGLGDQSSARIGQPLHEAITRPRTIGCRPILMASLVALFGFIPMALSHGAGAEVQRPLATVVIGGLMTSTPFTLYVLPIVYGWFVPDTDASALRSQPPAES